MRALARQAVQRFANYDDLAKAECTIEERTMLDADVRRGEESLVSTRALNDVVVNGGGVYVGENPSGQDTLLKLADQQSPAAMAITTSAALGPVLSIVGDVDPDQVIAQVDAECIAPGPVVLLCRHASLADSCCAAKA